MAAVNETGNYKVLSATGAVTANGGSLLGYYVNSTSSGVIGLKDGGASGTSMGGDMTPAAGTFHRFPATFGNGGLYMTLTSGSINVTFFYVPGAQA